MIFHERDVRADVFRLAIPDSDATVRAIHIPTGIVVEHTHRSQLIARNEALDELARKVTEQQ